MTLSTNISEYIDLVKQITTVNEYGEETSADGDTHKVRASIQPLAGTAEERFVLPEGVRVDDTRLGFLETKVDITIASRTSWGDEIDYNGERWRIVDLSDWRSIGGFAEVLLTRKYDTPTS